LTNGEERTYCPDCGRVTKKGDRFCKFCGADLRKSFATVSEPEVHKEALPSDEEWFGFFGRLRRFVTSPSEAMRDVVLAPDYGGVFTILIMELVLTWAVLILVSQKIQFVGSNASQVSTLLLSVLFLGGIFAFGSILVRWLVKSVLVLSLCGARSGWSFRTAAVVTGYAYFADVVVNFFALFIGWFLIPSVSINTSSLNTMAQSLAQYETSVAWLQFVYTLPTAFAGLLWKSYLG